MTSDRWHAIEAIFDEAADLPPSDRPVLLDRVCRAPDGAPDPALRREVERLLALDVGAEAFFERWLPPAGRRPRPARGAPSGGA